MICGEVCILLVQYMIVDPDFVCVVLQRVLK